MYGAPAGPEPGALNSGDLRSRINAALQDSMDRCARCKACDYQVDAVMAVLAATEPPAISPAVARQLGCTCAELLAEGADTVECPVHQGYPFGGEPPPLSSQVAVSVILLRSCLTDAIRACERDVMADGPDMQGLLSEYRAALAGLGTAGVTP
jgi:hypothetical protein